MKTIKAEDNWITLDDEAIANIREALRSAVTQGEMTLRASCARKWYYRYAMRLEKRGFLDWNLVYGSLMHMCLEELYRTNAWKFPAKVYPIEISDDMMAEATNAHDGMLLSPKALDEAELIRAKVKIAFDAYRLVWYEKDSKLQIRGVEHEVEYEFEGILLKAKIDMIAKPNKNDGLCIWDFKTARKLDALDLDAWTFKFQFLFYCWIYWKVYKVKPIGIMVNGLVKSALRPKIVDRKTKQRESMEEYLLRMKGEMTQNREEYFFRQRIPLGDGALERFEAEILIPHVHAFRLLSVASSEFPYITNALALQMNTNQCHIYGSYCEYLSICKDGQMALSEFDKREYKHSEYKLDKA